MKTGVFKNFLLSSFIFLLLTHPKSFKDQMSCDTFIQCSEYWIYTYSLTDIASSCNKPWISRKNDKAVKIVKKTQILLWKTIEG